MKKNNLFFSIFSAEKENSKSNNILTWLPRHFSPELKMILTQATIESVKVSPMFFFVYLRICLSTFI